MSQQRQGEGSPLRVPAPHPRHGPVLSPSTRALLSAIRAGPISSPAFSSFGCKAPGTHLAPPLMWPLTLPLQLQLCERAAVRRKEDESRAVPPPFLKAQVWIQGLAQTPRTHSSVLACVPPGLAWRPRPRRRPRPGPPPSSSRRLWSQPPPAPTIQTQRTQTCFSAPGAGGPSRSTL